MSDFYETRDNNRIFEVLLIQILNHFGIPAFLNPAPDPDDATDEYTRQLWLKEREAYDVGVGSQVDPISYLEVKADWWYSATRNICVEAPTLQHTKSDRIVFFLPKPSSILIHTFTRQQAIELYNAKNETLEGFNTWKYPHKLVGDKKAIPAVLLPDEIRETHGLNLWEVVKNIKQKQAA